MLEELANPFRSALHAAQMAGSGLDELELGACGGELGDGLLQMS